MISDIILLLLLLFTAHCRGKLGKNLLCDVTGYLSFDSSERMTVKIRLVIGCEVQYISGFAM